MLAERVPAGLRGQKTLFFHSGSSESRTLASAEGMSCMPISKKHIKIVTRVLAGTEK